MYGSPSNKKLKKKKKKPIWKFGTPSASSQSYSNKSRRGKERGTRAPKSKIEKSKRYA